MRPTREPDYVNTSPLRYDAHTYEDPAELNADSTLTEIAAKSLSLYDVIHRGTDYSTRLRVFTEVWIT